MAEINAHLQPQSHNSTYSGYFAQHVSDRDWLAQWQSNLVNTVYATIVALTKKERQALVALGVRDFV